jgi:hypothetical protein
MMKACCTSPHVVVGWIISYLANQSTTFPLREFGKYYGLWLSISSPLVTQTLISCCISITRSSLSWYFGSWMCKTLVCTTTMSGFTFIIVATIVVYRVDKVITFNKSRLGVDPNSSLFNGRSLLPLLLWVFTDFPSTCRLGIRGHLTRPQVLCVTQKGSKELDLQKWLETWCRSQLSTLKGVEGSCWKLQD